VNGGPAVVLDSSALLAFLQDEPGAEAVEGALAERAAMSAANWAEVLTKMADAGVPPQEVTRRLEAEGVLGDGLAIVPLGQAAAEEIAGLRTQTRRVGLSLGDRACLALARNLGLPAMTADRAWAALSLSGVKVEVIR
jgi:PIN domain nuclease of toxin-antitoxin system